MNKDLEEDLSGVRETAIGLKSNYTSKMDSFYNFPNGTVGN